jgi:hypothetical protein
MPPSSETDTLIVPETAVSPVLAGHVVPGGFPPPEVGGGVADGEGPDGADGLSEADGLRDGVRDGDGLTVADALDDAVGKVGPVVLGRGVTVVPPLQATPLRVNDVGAALVPEYVALKPGPAVAFVARALLYSALVSVTCRPLWV